MGFYSLLGSFTGMLSTLWVVLLTFWSLPSSERPVSARQSYAVCGAIAALATLVAVLPLVGVGRMRYTEGFCYGDFTSPALAAIMLAINACTISATIVLLLLCLFIIRGHPVVVFDLVQYGHHFI